MVNVVEVLRRKHLTDTETVLVVVSMRQAGLIKRDSAMPILIELLEDRALAAIKEAKKLMDDTDILDIVEEYYNERGTDKTKA